MTNLFTKKITMRILIILTIFSIWGCNKSDVELNTLPAETQTGANTFGAVIRGQIWTTNGKYCKQLGGCRENPSANYFTIDTPFNASLGLSADKVMYKGLSFISRESFDFRFYRNFTGIGIYHLKQDNSLDIQYEYADKTNNKYYQLLQDRETFELNITKFDTIAKIISGKFSGTLFNQFAPTDSIKINEGRFDIKLK